MPLGIQLRDDATFRSYYPGGNALAVATVSKMAEACGEQFVYLWGKSGVGKSHLLQAACHRAPETFVSAVYLPLLEYTRLKPDLLDHLEEVNLICLDDLQCMAGNPVWEESLFHLYNRVRDQHRRLLVSATAPPTAIGIQLPDLKSRLTWGVSFQLTPLSDEEIIAALKIRASARGLHLDDALGNFLLKRCPRDMQQLFLTLERLDQASLAKQRRLTIPFVKETLGM